MEFDIIIFDSILKKTELLSGIQNPYTSLLFHFYTIISTMSSSYYMCVPSHNKKGPLRAKDVEQARMPCYIASDHQYFHNGTLPYPPSTTLLHHNNKKLINAMYSQPNNNNMHHLLRRHPIPRNNLPPTTMQACLPQAMY